MKKFIKDLKVKDSLESVYLLRNKEMQRTKDNKPYLRLLLSDKTGQIEAKVWDDAEAFNARIEAGVPVMVKAEVDSWKENIQLKIGDIRGASAQEYRIEDLIRTVENAGEIFDNMKKYLDGLSDKGLSDLAKGFLRDEEFVSRFRQSPGAKSWHNAYIGGLLEHTWEVMVITDRVCDLYPQASRDMCIMGAFLHDIGKVLEIDIRSFEYTLEGGLIGHLPLGFEMLIAKIAEIDGFPRDLALHLKHIVLSHHGEYQQQSPVLPKTLEATIIYQADALVSQANAVKELTQAEQASRKDWSNYVSIKNRKYLLKKLS